MRKTLTVFILAISPFVGYSQAVKKPKLTDQSVRYLKLLQGSWKIKGDKYGSINIVKDSLFSIDLLDKAIDTFRVSIRKSLIVDNKKIETRNGEYLMIYYNLDGSIYLYDYLIALTNKYFTIMAGNNLQIVEYNKMIKSRPVRN